MRFNCLGYPPRKIPKWLNVLKKPARLEFKFVHRTRTPTGPYDTTAPVGYEVKALDQEAPDGAIATSYLFVKRLPEMTGEAIAKSNPSVGEFGAYEIQIKFTSEGGDQFAELTREIVRGNTTNIPGRLAITLDGELLTAPSVQEVIPGGSARITGSFTLREAQQVSNGLNNPLDIPLRVAEMYEVEPTLARESIDSGIKAFSIGATAVVLFMLGYYLVAGLVALIAVVVNLIIVLGTLASIDATLTLPGIAALVLTIGMAVDANILIFERMREELRTGKTLPNALLGGFDKALSTILDANVTTLITSFILIFFGTGPVKGFGVTLAIGIGATLFWRAPGQPFHPRSVGEHRLCPAHVHHRFAQGTQNQFPQLPEICLCHLLDHRSSGNRRPDLPGGRHLRNRFYGRR